MSSPDHALPPGDGFDDRLQRYGKYFLLRKLAEGGMAEIFLAKHIGAEGFERNVVIKRMLKHLSDEPAFVTMFLDEARLAARLTHQNIVQIHDLGLVDGCYFICMEYLAGEDFSTVLRSAGRRREYVPLHVVLRVMADAAHGLHFAHEFADETGRALHIVHRDISPSNLFVTFQGQVKVLDFGIARAETRSTKTTAGVVKGKYMYMSPEQARSLPVDRRADVFSLGVSLYEALTNTRPFARDTDLAILNSVLTGEFVPPKKLRPDIPAEVEQIVLQAMSTSPQQRFQSAAEFAAAIEQYLQATTPNTGSGAVTSYLRNLFGEERVAQKTRIPTLEMLIQSGHRVTGFTDPEMPAVAVPAVRTPVTEEGATRAVGPPSSVTVAEKRKPRWPLVAGALALLVAAAASAGGYFAMKQGAAATAAVTAASADAPAVHPTPPSDHPAPAVAEAPPPAVAAPVPVAAIAPTVDAGVQEVVPAKATAPASKSSAHKRIKLTAIEIQKVVNRGRGPVMRCFEQHKEDLPSDQGQVTVQFTILGSGRVTDAHAVGPLAKTGVGRCLAQRVAAIRFPLNDDDRVSLALPFEYRVQR